MLNATEREDVTPICPHCRTGLAGGVWFRRVEGFLGRRYLYFCPSCLAALGVSHRKGFWMG